MVTVIVKIYLKNIYIHIYKYTWHAHWHIYQPFRPFWSFFAMDFPGHNLGLRHATRHGSLVYLLDDLPGTRIAGPATWSQQVVSKKPGPLRDLCPRNTASGFPNTKLLAVTGSHWPPRELVIRYAEQLKTLQRHGGVGFFLYERATPCPYTFRLALGCGKQLLAPFCNAEARPWINDCAVATSADSQFSSSWSLKGCYRVHTKHNQNVSTITFSDLGRQKKKTAWHKMP